MSKETFQTLTAGNRKFDIIIDDASHAWGEQRFKPKLVDTVPFFDYMLNLSHILRWTEQEKREECLNQFAEYSPQVHNIVRTLDMLSIVPGAMILKRSGQNRTFKAYEG